MLCEPGKLGPELVRLLTDATAREGLASVALERSREFALPRVLDRYETYYRDEYRADHVVDVKSERA